MHKRYVFLSLTFLLAFALTSSAAFGLYETTDPWPMHRHNPERTGATTSTAPNTNNTLWTYETYYSFSNIHSTIIADGKVIFVDYRNIKALDETTGVELWTSMTFPNSLKSELAYADAKIYVGSDGGFLYCINAATGAKLWEYNHGTGNIRSGPAVVDGKVYFGTSDNYLYALNASNGLYLWRYTAAGAIYSSPTISEDLLYFGCDDGKVYALNITGSLPALKWTYTTPSSQRVRGAIAVYGDRIFFGSYTADNSVFALDKNTGIWIWTCTLPNNYHIENSVAVADSIVYVIPSYNGPSNEIVALYANAVSGTYAYTDPAIRKWSTTIGYGGLNYGSEPVVADDKVFFSHYSDSKYRVTALHARDGTPVWSYAFSSGYVGRPVIADGRLFMIRNKYVYCFGSPYPPVTYHYQVSAGGQDFDIVLTINATPGELDSSTLITLKKISYELEGIPGTIGMSNITIPNQMLGGSYTVTVDGGLPLYSASPVDNGTHTSLYFTYFQSIHTVEITGTTVIPEFSSAIILPLLFILTLIAASFARKKLPSN